MNEHTTAHARTLTQIAKYEAHITADDALIQNSPTPKKYHRRRANHAAKLQRQRAKLNSLINADTQAASAEAEKTAEIILTCTAHKRGEISLNITLPDGTTESTRANRFNDRFSIALHQLSEKAEAWLRTAGQVDFNLYTAAKLRRGQYHTLKFNPLQFQSILKDTQTDRTGF